METEKIDYSRNERITAKRLGCSLPQARIFRDAFLQMCQEARLDLEKDTPEEIGRKLMSLKEKYDKFQ